MITPYIGTFTEKQQQHGLQIYEGNSSVECLLMSDPAVTLGFLVQLATLKKRKHRKGMGGG